MAIWPRVLLGIVGIVGGACFPASEQVRPELQARTDLHGVREAIERYVDSTGHLPVSLSDVCPTGVGDTGCPHWPMGRPFVDPWGQPFHYERRGNRDYFVALRGPDRQLGTADDIRFRLSDELKWVRAAAECYRLEGVEWPGYHSDQLVLDTTRVATGLYAARPSVLNYSGPWWYPPDSTELAVEWLEIHERVMFRMTDAGDSLIGEFSSGRGGDDYRAPRQGGDTFVARRVTCLPGA